MSVAVDQILAKRARRTGRRPEAASLLAALLLHATMIAAVLLLPRLTPPPEPLEFVPVTILPAQALGVRRPAARPRSETPRPPEPEPAAEEPEPPTPEPEPERPEPRPSQEDVPVLPDPDKKPEKKPEKPKPAASDRATKPAAETPRKPEKPPEPSSGGSGGTGTNPAGTAAQGDPEGEAGRRGSPTGNPLGTSAFGSEIAGLDNPDFTYGYYIDQLLSAIDANWVRPPLGGEVRAIIHFRIERNGEISDLRVAESSGYNSFDLAAVRAVQNAAPFPRLPRAYRHDSLGVNLIVR